MLLNALSVPCDREHDLHCHKKLVTVRMDCQAINSNDIDIVRLFSGLHHLFRGIDNKFSEDKNRLRL